MSWWPFSSSPSSASAADPPKPQSEPSPSQFAPDNAFHSPTQAPSKALTQDEQATRDLESFLHSLERETPATSSPSTHESIADADADSATTASTADQRLTATGDLDISPQALYPRTMSCRAAFDQAFYCQSLGGKFNDIYRHGAIQSCSEQWGAFWFCMRVRTLGDTERQERIAEFYREREEGRKREKGSSEDIWTIRTQAVQRAFWRDPDAVQTEGG